jgi:predicted O-methyltransferase YrrM
MSRKLWTRVERYVDGMLLQSDPTMEAVLEASLEAGLPQINVTPSQGRLLWILAKALKAREILEIGTLGGYSAIWMARALPPGGRLLTLEADPRNARVARENIERAGLGERIEVRLGRGLSMLPKVAAERRGPFDMTFIDADKPNNAAYFRWAIKLSRPGSLIIVDNVVREGEVVDGASRDPDVLGVRRLNDLIRTKKGVSATTIQTVGSKGYDGFAIALVTDGQG